MADEVFRRAAELLEQGTEHDAAEPMSDEDEAAWGSARTLGDLGELTVQWLEGKLGQTPDCPAPHDEETRPLVPVLAAANRAGYMTDCSQPAEAPVTGYDGRTWEQRAAVSGFATDRVLDRIRQAVNRAGLLLIARKAGQLQVSYRDAIPVTCADEEPVTWFGAISNRDEVTRRYDICHPDAIKALGEAWQVSIVDLEWGRNDAFWPALERFAAGR